MEQTSYKLVVSDLDGTLVNYGSNQISDTTKNAVSSFVEHGGLFTVSTGRSWNQAQEMIKELSITLPVIVQAGAIIVDPVRGKVLRTRPLRRRIVTKLYEISGYISRRNIAVDQFFLGENGVYYTTKVTTDGGNWLLQNREKCQILKNRRLNPRPVIKYLLIGARPEMEQILKILKEIKPKPNIILWPPDQESGDWFLEVFDPLASKGNALYWLVNYLKIGLEEVIAFGDGHNDLDMLQWAGLGVAMEAAPAELLTTADLVIPGPEKDGIARFLNQLVEKGRGKNLKYKGGPPSCSTISILILF